MSRARAHAHDTYKPKPPRLAKGEALAELHRLASLSLAEQESTSRIAIKIGGTVTHWCRPINDQAPPFRNIRGSTSRRLLIWDAATKSVVIYDTRHAPESIRRILHTSDPARILAELPQSMFAPSDPKRAASEPQLVALRKLLDLPTTTELPQLHMMAASRLMDRILAESMVLNLSADLATLREPAQLQVAG